MLEPLIERMTLDLHATLEDVTEEFNNILGKLSRKELRAQLTQRNMSSLNKVLQGLVMALFRTIPRAIYRHNPLPTPPTPSPP